MTLPSPSPAPHGSGVWASGEAFTVLFGPFFPEHPLSGHQPQPSALARPPQHRGLRPLRRPCPPTAGLSGQLPFGSWFRRCGQVCVCACVCADTNIAQKGAFPYSMCDSQVVCVSWSITLFTLQGTFCGPDKSYTHTRAPVCTHVHTCTGRMPAHSHGCLLLHSLPPIPHAS